MLQFNAHEVYEILRTKRDNLSPHKSNAVALGRTRIPLSNLKFSSIDNLHLP